MFAAYHQTIFSSTVSTSRRADALPPTGSVHLVGQGKPGYNRWKRITGAQSTRCGHWRRIVRCGGRYDPRWSSAAVSVWVSVNNMGISCCLRDCGSDIITQAPRPAQIRVTFNKQAVQQSRALMQSVQSTKRTICRPWRSPSSVRSQTSAVHLLQRSVLLHFWSNCLACVQCTDAARCICVLYELVQTL